MPTNLLRTLLGATLTLLLWGILQPPNVIASLVIAFCGFGISYALFMLFGSAAPEEFDALIEAGRLSEAKAQAEALQRADPSDPTGWHQAARIALREGDRAEAERLVAVALELAPDQPDALAVRDALQARD